MGIIAFTICFTFLIISLVLNRKKNFSPVVLFFALWSFILFLSILKLYNIYTPSDETYFLIILMIVFFFIGNILNILFRSEFKRTSKDKTNDLNSDAIIKPKFKLFYILSFAVIVFNIIDLIIIIKQIMGGTPMWQIRNWSLAPYGTSNPILDRRSFIEDAFRSIILVPLATIVHPIAAYYFFNTKENKQRYKLLVISLMVLISSSLAGGGGRLGFIYYFGCFILAFLIANKNKEVSKDKLKKYKKFMILLCVFGVLFIIIYTTIRTGTGNFIKQIYTYFALPPTLLSIWLPDIKNVEYTYGMTTFFGLHSYFFRVLDTIGLDFLVPQIYSNAYTNILNAEIFKNVGYGIGNAFVTPIYYFFVDGGYPFVCSASLIFGYVVSSLYERFERNINVRSFTMYVLITYGVFLTFVRVQTAIPAYVISFIFACFILTPFKQRKYKNVGKLKGGKNNE